MRHTIAIITGMAALLGPSAWNSLADDLDDKPIARESEAVRTAAVGADDRGPEFGLRAPGGCAPSACCAEQDRAAASGDQVCSWCASNSLVAATDVVLEPGPPFGRGRGRGRGAGQGRGRGSGAARGQRDQRFAEDHDVLFFLLDNRKSIRRDIKVLENGIETLTESDDPEVAGKIQEHVSAMYDRVENVRPIRLRDPLFRELFSNTEKIAMKIEVTDKGVRVVETSEDPYVANLIKAHARVVSLFIKNGRAELPRNHAVPTTRRP